MNNRLSGAFSYGIAITSAVNFTVEDNVLFGNTSFIGARGPNCSTSDSVPTPAAFVLDTNLTSALTYQSDFEIIADGESLTCVLPPDGGDYWPFGGNPSTATNSSSSSTGSSSSGGSSGGSSSGRTAGIAVGVIVGVIVVAVLSFFIRRWATKRAETKRLFEATKRTGYTQSY